jgi:UDP-glucose 4-epimerase
MILVTGANGFVGSAVAKRLAHEFPGDVRAAVRQTMARPLANVEYVPTVGLFADTDWSLALRGVRSIVHAAARVHVMRESAADPLAEFRRVNVDGMLLLARQAVRAGVRRFVFISSIKVNGEATSRDRPFTADDPPQPLDPYGVSKLEGEQGLLELAKTTGLEVVIVRPPLVYGPGVKANFFSMMKWLRRGVPLPFGAIHNRRSLVGIDNLVDLLAVCVRHPSAPGSPLLVSDGEDLSTTDLLRRLGYALGTPARLIPIPERLIDLTARAVGGAKLAQRLCGSLCVDIAATRRRLGWSPPVSVDEELRQAAEAFAK